MIDEESNAATEVSGCEHETLDPHTCPFREDVRGDATPCTCCEWCQRQCAEDI